MGDAIVVDHIQAIPGELVIQKLVSQVELDSQQKKVKELTCKKILYIYSARSGKLFVLTDNKGGKIPGVVVENCLEIFDKLFNNSFLHHPIIILGLLTDHYRSLALGTK